MKISIIDDNYVVLNVISIMLKKESIIEDNDILEKYISISSFEEKHKNDLSSIDILSCDYDLGANSINGLEFLNSLIKNGFNGVCILLTGDDTHYLRKEVAKSPFIHYVIKNATNDKEKSTINQISKIIKLKRRELNEYK